MHVKGGTKQRRQEWRQSKERSKETFTEEECLFMKLMKGANFERDDYTRIHDHQVRSVCKAVSLPWTWRYILSRFNTKHVLCDRSLPRTDRARRCLDELGWNILQKHDLQKQASAMLPSMVPYQRTAVFNQLPCPSLRNWIHRLKSTVFSSTGGPFQRQGLHSPCQHDACEMEGGRCCRTTRSQASASFATARPRM